MKIQHQILVFTIFCFGLSCQSKEHKDSIERIALVEPDTNLLRTPSFPAEEDALLYDVITATGIDWPEGCSYFNGFDSTNTRLFCLSELSDAFYVAEFSGLCGQGTCGYNVYAFKREQDTVRIIMDACGWIDSISPVVHNGMRDFILGSKTYGDQEDSGLDLCQYDGEGVQRKDVPMEKTLDYKIAESMVQSEPELSDLGASFLSKRINCIPVDLGLTEDLSYWVFCEYLDLPFLVVQHRANQFQVINDFSNALPYASIGPDIQNKETNGVKNVRFYEYQAMGKIAKDWKWNGNKYVPDY